MTMRLGLIGLACLPVACSLAGLSDGVLPPSAAGGGAGGAGVAGAGPGAGGAAGGASPTGPCGAGESAFEWLCRYGNDGDQGTIDVGDSSQIKIASSSRGVVLVAKTRSAVDFGDGNIGEQDANNLLVARFSPTGALEATAHIAVDAASFTLEGVALSPAGRLALVGSFQGGTLGTAPVQLRNPHNNRDGYIVVLEADGTYVGARRLKGASANGEHQDAMAVSFDEAGDLLVAGRFVGQLVVLDEADARVGAERCALDGDASEDAFVLKLGPELGCRWGVSLGSARAAQRAFAVAAAPRTRDVLVGGTFQGTVELSAREPPLVSRGGDDAFVLKLDAAGNRLWAKPLGAGQSDSVRHLAADETGVYLTGFHDRDITVDQCAVTASNRDVLVAKLDARDGACVWATSLGEAEGDEGRSLALLPGGPLAVAGFFTRDLALEDGSMHPSAGSKDGFLVWVDTEVGTASLGAKIDSTGPDTVDGVAAVSDELAVYVAGSYNAPFDVLPPPVQPEDFFLGKLRGLPR